MDLKSPDLVSPDVHTEAVQAALAKHRERKMAVPMPSKRRSLVVQTSMDAYTPPGKQPADLQDVPSSSSSPLIRPPPVCLPSCFSLDDRRVFI